MTHPVWQPPPGFDPRQPPPPKPSTWHRLVTKRPVWLLAAVAVATLLLGIGVGAANQPTPQAAERVTVPGPTVTVPGPTVTKTVPGPTKTVPGPTVTKTVPGPTVTVTAPPPVAPVPSTPGSQWTDAKVAITGCELDANNWMTAYVVITNTGTENHDYFVTVSFTNAAGSQMATGMVSATNLSPGQSTTAQEANSLTEARGSFHCAVTTVDTY
jgi:hypothetical protein